MAARGRTSSAAVISGRRLWAFRLVTVAMALLAVGGGLAAVEAGLRLVRYGYDPSPTIEYRLDGERVVADNVHFSERFFPAHLAREFETFRFAAKKAEGTCRIFVLGASAAQGVPDGAYAFARVLGELLDAAYPEVRFEVINAGMTAINSHVVLPIARGLARHEPDIVVVYLGNNEVVGPYGAGTVFSPIRSSLRVIRAGVALRELRLGQWLAGLGGQDRAETMRSWGGMQMFLDSQVRADDPRLETVYRHYRRNLEDICRAGTHAGAEVLLCTVGTNLRDCPPFLSLHSSVLSKEQQRQWQVLYAKAVALEDKEQYEAALEVYEEAYQIDGEYAEMHFRRGRCLEALGRPTQAREAYLAARQYDALRFRADRRINATVREVAGDMQGEGVRLVDVEEMLAEQSQDGVPGSEWFHEHVHLTFAGNYRVAWTLFRQLQPILERRFGQDSAERPVLDEQSCRERLAFTGLDEYVICNSMLEEYYRKPPFTNQLGNERRQEELAARREELARHGAEPLLSACMQRYRDAIAADPDDWYLQWKMGILLTAHADPAGAEQAFGRVQELMPHFHRGYLAMGQVLLSANKLSEAAVHLRKAVELRPSNAESHYHLGRALHRMNRLEEAVESYQAVLRWQANYRPVYDHLGEVLSNLKRYEEAAGLCQRAISVWPEDAVLHCNLGVALTFAGRPVEARQAFETALRLDPDSERIRSVVRQVLGSGR